MHRENIVTCGDSGYMLHLAIGVEILKADCGSTWFCNIDGLS